MKNASVGMITPSSNTVVERTLAAVTCDVAGDLVVHYTRLGVKEISLRPESARQFQLADMLGAARLLADAKPSVISWNGTSGAWRGLQADRQFCNEVRQEFGIPATTASLAQVEAFRLYGVTRFSLVVPYQTAVGDAISRVYSREGFSCVRSTCLGISENFEISQVSESRIRDAIRSSDSETSQAIAVVCTNLAAATVVEEMEAELNKPIFDSLLLAIWHPLRMLGWGKPIPRWGQLLRRFPGAATNAAPEQGLEE